MSFAIRIYAVNCFLLSLFSYVGRVVLLPQPLIRQVMSAALDLVTPVPFCSVFCLTHLQGFMGISSYLRDLQIDNIAGVLATALKLQATGGLAPDQVDEWVVDVMQDEDAVTRDQELGNISTHTPRPLAHVALAYYVFYRITGQTVDRVHELRVRRLGQPKALQGLQAALYRMLITCENHFCTSTYRTESRPLAYLGTRCGITLPECQLQCLRRTELRCSATC